jgi:hypothetical protein
VVRSRAR